MKFTGNRGDIYTKVINYLKNILMPFESFSGVTNNQSSHIITHVLCCQYFIYENQMFLGGGGGGLVHHSWPMGY